MTWAPDNFILHLIGHGGKQQNVFYRYNRESGKSSKWLDLPGDFSHEYFPKMSDDGRYLIFGASTGGYEHDIADYEIFLWQIGTAGEDATRVTFHAGNDCWPDIYIAR